MTEERKSAILFSATILAARKLAEIGDKPCPAREMCMEDAIRGQSIVTAGTAKRDKSGAGSGLCHVSDQREIVGWGYIHR